MTNPNTKKYNINDDLKNNLQNLKTEYKHLNLKTKKRNAEICIKNATHFNKVKERYPEYEYAHTEFEDFDKMAYGEYDIDSIQHTFDIPAKPKIHLYKQEY